MPLSPKKKSGKSPLLIVVSGLPGTGKTTLARALAQRMSAPHHNTDGVRNQLGKRGQYDAASKLLVYQTLLERTRTALAAGGPVVVDATFYQEELRRPYVELAQQTAAPILWVELHAAEHTVRQRVSQVRPDSEADFAVYRQVRERYEPPTLPHLNLQSDSLSIDEMVAAVLAELSLFDKKPPQ